MAEATIDSVSKLIIIMLKIKGHFKKETTAENRIKIS